MCKSYHIGVKLYLYHLVHFLSLLMGSVGGNQEVFGEEKTDTRLRAKFEASRETA